MPSMTRFNIPLKITQGDAVTWSEEIAEYDPNVDTLICYVRGESRLDLAATNNSGLFEFAITSDQSNDLQPGKYKAQFVIDPQLGQRKTLGIAEFEVCPSFANLDSLETRSPDEIELEELNKAIAKLATGVQEYEIGERRVKYTDLPSLYKRKRQLQRRINLKKNPHLRNGRNTQINFG